MLYTGYITEFSTLTKRYTAYSRIFIQTTNAVIIQKFDHHMQSL